MNILLKNRLKRFSPSLYFVAKKIFLFSTKSFQNFIGLDVPRLSWSLNSTFPSDVELATQLQSPRRAYLAKFICRHLRTDSICELGTYTGLNLFFLLANSTSITVTGVDISSRAVAYAEKLLRSYSRSSSYRLLVSKSPFADTSKYECEAILLDAILLYFPHHKVLSSLLHLYKAGIKQVFISELSFASSANDSSHFNGHYFEHNILSIVHHFSELYAIPIAVMDDPGYSRLWDDLPWSTHGKLLLLEFSA